MQKFLIIFILSVAILSCSNNNKPESKGIQVNEITDENGKKTVGLPIDSLHLETRPRNVLLTKNPGHQLVPLFKVNVNKRNGQLYTGYNNYHRNWEEQQEGNNWNNNFMPGFAALYGYNLINVSHYNKDTKVQNEFFQKPVLINTLYYPAFSKDTLNYQAVTRDFYMVSVYDEDSNKDGFINFRDLRRLYHFDIDGFLKKELVPKNYSVMNSEYDSQNDRMYVFARLDQNNNGKMEQEEPTHIFWIDLKNPDSLGVLYKD